MNCLGRLSRDSGHMRDPDPPHMITGRIFAIRFSASASRRSELPRPMRLLCNTGRAKAMPGRRPAFTPRAGRPGRPAHGSKTTAAAAAVVASATAKAAKALGSDSVCAIAPVASGAGRRVSVLNSEAEASPTAGPASDWRAASAKLQGTIGPVPTPMRAKPATLAAKPAWAPTRAKPAAAIAKAAIMMRRSGTRSRIASALKRSAAWQAEKNAAPRPDIAASLGASSRRRASTRARPPIPPRSKPQ